MHQDKAREVGEMVYQIAKVAGESSSDAFKTVGFATLMLMRCAVDDPEWATKLLNAAEMNVLFVSNLGAITTGIKGDLHG